jgi:prevent-host-death family protein
MAAKKPRRRAKPAPKSVNVHEAKTHLSRLLERVSRGEEIVIGRAGKPVAKLVPYVPQSARRVLGQATGQIRMAPDFDELAERVRREFEEGPLFPE